MNIFSHGSARFKTSYIDLSPPKSKGSTKVPKKIKCYRNRVGGQVTAPIDETMFSITPLSLEEQIASVQKRQESTSYMNAPFKCTVCFTGFNHRGTLETHSFRHSDVSAFDNKFLLAEWIGATREKVSN